MIDPEWDPERRLITLTESAKSLDRPASTLRRWVSEGRLRYHSSAGGIHYYLESDVLAVEAATHHRSRRAPFAGPSQASFDAWNAEVRRTTIICIMPGCEKTRSALPKLHLCDAHLTVIHDQVAEMKAALHQSQMDQYNATQQNEPSEPPPGPGTIYYIQSGGHIKIGWTSNLTKRMHQYPPNCLLLATHPGTRPEEQRLHKIFAVHRSHGREWYPLAPVILAHIDRMVALHGSPAKVAFGAKPVTVPQYRAPHYMKHH